VKHIIYCNITISKLSTIKIQGTVLSTTNPRAVYVEFVVNKLHRYSFFSEHFSFPMNCLIPPMLHIHIHSSLITAIQYRY